MYLVLNIILKFIGFYLVIIGTWRLANATKRAPIGADLWKRQEEARNYSPLQDLISPMEVLLWFFKTVKSFNKPGSFTTAVLMQKEFNWGLIWLLLGLLMQFLTGF
jgi:hypothetical protein